MYAIVDIAGQQFKVEKGRKIFVHRLDAEVGATLDFEKVLLTDNEGEVKVGKRHKRLLWAYGGVRTITSCGQIMLPKRN